MPSWNADQYLRFAEERTQPSRDLAARIAIEAPRRIIDLGCGPGNSTRILMDRWPGAEISGLDGSPAMIATARRDYPAEQFPGVSWSIGDITAWAAEPGPSFDLIYSNAALQWVPDHAALYPELLSRVSAGGALAVQIPANIDALAHRAMRELAASPPWREYFPAAGVREWHAHPAEFYYDLLARDASRVDIWKTEYLHVLSGVAAVVDWYRGTGLRPFLDPLPSDALRDRFQAEYLERIRPLYPERPDCRVLFPFLRLFMIAYR